MSEDTPSNRYFHTGKGKLQMYFFMSPQQKLRFRVREGPRFEGFEARQMQASRLICLEKCRRVDVRVR